MTQMLERYSFLLENPGVRIERADPQTDQVVVMLIPYLLEFVEPARPERREFDLYALPLDDFIRIAIGAARDVQIPRSAPAGEELLSEFLLLFQSLRHKPGIWTAAPLLPNGLPEADNRIVHVLFSPNNATVLVSAHVMGMGRVEKLVFAFL